MGGCTGHSLGNSRHGGTRSDDLDLEGHKMVQLSTKEPCPREEDSSTENGRS
jgi:hypothetical protein